MMQNRQPLIRVTLFAGLVTLVGLGASWLGSPQRLTEDASQWREGRYAVRITSASTVGRDAQVRLELTTDLQLDKVGPGEARLRFIAPELRVTAQPGGAKSSSPSGPPRQLEDGWISFEGGAEPKVEFNERWPQPVRALAFGLAAELVSPVQGDAAEAWGPFGWAALSSEGPLRTSRRYLRPHVWQPPKLTLTTERSARTLVAEAGKFIGLSSHEEVRIDAARLGSTHSRWSLELSYEGVGETPVPHRPRLAPARTALAAEMPAPARMPPEALTAAWLKVTRFIPAAMSNPFARDMIVEGSDLLRAHPELVDDVVRAYFEHRARAAARGFAVDLLASAGTAEAQRGMWRIYHRVERREASERTFILQSASILRAPTAETVQAVLEATSDAEKLVRHTATLAAGALGAADPSRAPTVLSALQGQWGQAAAADAPEELAQVAAALGNLGTPEALPQLEQALARPEAPVRRSAAYGLRKLRSDRSRELLTELALDDDLHVRGAAFDALAQRPDVNAETAEAVLESLRSKGLPTSGRASAIGLLARVDSLKLRNGVRALLDRAPLRPKERERLGRALRARERTAP